MANRTLPLLKGTLDLLILKTLSVQPRHGFGIVRCIDETTDGVFFVEEGSLYPALHRLERQKLVRGSWQLTETGRRAKFYTLTAAGRRRLTSETRDWALVQSSMAKVLALKS